MTLTVAVGELTRVLPWSLRALGYPFGTADRAAHLLALAAALDATVLDRVPSYDSRPETAFRIERSPGALSVEAAGHSLLEVGPAVIDHLAGRASENAVSVATLRGVVNPELLPAVLLVGTDYGFNTFALSPDNAGGGWVAALYESGHLMLQSGNDAESVLPELSNLVSKADRTGLHGSGTVIVMTSEPPDLARADKGADVQKAVANANAGGIAISAETLKGLYALEMITWAPTSERSRAQAGFIPKSGAAT